MTRWAERLKKTLLLNPWLKWVALPVAALTLIGTGMSQSTFTTPQVALASTPLYAQGARAKPALMLALSVEFPTVGAQYLGTQGSASDATYAATTQYLGYFDSEGCYTYNDTPTEGAAATYARFDRSANATSHTCGGTGFSGNFMNWASSSAIDILRYGLTGGDRVVDTSSLTILQRAVLPNTNVSGNFWNGTNFPDKQISASVAATVLPSSMVASATGTIHIANCLNRIHFGSAATGSCASPGANSVYGVAGSTTGPITTYAGTLASAGGFTNCASENGTCSFTGIKQVAFGAGNSWLFMSASNGLACNLAAFNNQDPAYGTVKACYIRTDPTGWSPSAGALTTDNFFYTRVSVCSSSAGTLSDPRPDLCQRYPSGQYKPTGNLQKYSDRVRVSAFGYLNDPTNNPNQRYGGVLRAPMKYVGPTSYDANFSLVSGTNPNQEWDSTTGVFFANPDGNSTIASGPTYTGPYLSGVTNYLNQFGRTGILGQYKTYDPVSELYYESLRYLQGLSPTPQAYTPLLGQTAQTLDDGYPVFTTWTDPNPAVAGMSTYTCVRNNIFVVGDIHTHNDGSIPGNTTRTTNDFSRPSDVAGTANPSPSNQPDFNYWMKVVGGFESGTSVTYQDGNGVSRTTVSSTNPTPITSLWGLENQTPPTSSDGSTYFMAGVAYWANTHDIRGAGWTAQPSLQRPGMRVTTYVLDVNENGDSAVAANHAKTQFFLAAKYGGFNDASGTGNPFLNKDGTVNNNDWQSPSTPGEANTYYLSSSAQAVLNGLNQIFASVAGQSGSIAGGAISTGSLNTVPGFAYQAKFNAAGWSGDVQAFTVTATSGSTGYTVSTSTTPSWQAAIELDAKSSATNPGGGNRTIVIGNSNASTATASDFNWTTSLPADVQTAMRTPPYSATGTALDPATTGQARLNYLRGDRSNEAPNGLLFRARTSTLGDIVNSGIVFSGAPTQNIADASYASFLSTYANRKHALFVGANDGMLHAFDPDNGTVTGHTGGNELFAYIPSWMISKLNVLTSPSYVHQSYVDATPTVAEALVGSTWKTVLVGGTGGGGAGVYALDVSDPAAFSPSKVMWEFTANDDPEMGQVIGAPQILKFRTNATGATATYKYFAVVASGVNNYANANFVAGTSSPATLFLLDLSKQVGTAWSLGTNYFKIEFGAAATTTANGMVSSNANPGDDGAVNAIYAGDLQGNLWKLDFTKATHGTSDWNLSTLSYYKNGSAAVPMYIAKDASGVRQPITMQPTLAYGTNRSIIVAFGTGKFLEAGDNTVTGAPVQSVYAIGDNGTNTLDSGTSSVAAVAGRARLAQGTVTTSSGNGTITPPAFNWGRPLTDSDTTQRSGWYVDFPNAGERQVSNFTLAAGYISFGSLVPSVNSCDSGTGNSYTVQITTGTGTFTQSNVGTLGQPFVVMVGGWNTSSADTTGRIWQGGLLQVIAQGSNGLSAANQQQIAQYAGRLSWRQINNYQQIRHQ